MEYADTSSDDQFFKRILDDAVRYSNDETPSPKRDVSDADTQTAHLIEQALDVVVAGSIFNLSPEQGRSLLTWTSSSRQATRQAAGQEGPHGGMAGAPKRVAHEFDIRLSLARSLTEVVHRECDAAPDRFAHAWDVCADSWRKSALALARCISAVKEDCRDTQLCELAALLENQLLGVQAGFSPCINDELQIEIPGFAEQRQSVRTAVNINATLVARGDSCAVRVIDVSKTGFGITNAPELMPGEMVSLALPKGELFSGCVRWWSAGKAGVEIESTVGAAFDATHYITAG